MKLYVTKMYNEKNVKLYECLFSSLLVIFLNSYIQKLELFVLLKQ